MSTYADAAGKTLKVHILSGIGGVMLDLYVVAAAFAVPGAGRYHTVAHRIDRRTRRCRIIHSVMCTYYLLDGMQTCLRESGADTGITERCLEECTPKAGALLVKILAALIMICISESSCLLAV